MSVIPNQSIGDVGQPIRQMPKLIQMVASPTGVESAKVPQVTPRAQMCRMVSMNVNGVLKKVLVPVKSNKPVIANRKHMGQVGTSPMVTDGTRAISPIVVNMKSVLKRPMGPIHLGPPSVMNTMRMPVVQPQRLLSMMPTRMPSVATNVNPVQASNRTTFTVANGNCFVKKMNGAGQTDVYVVPISQTGVNEGQAIQNLRPTVPTVPTQFNPTVSQNSLQTTSGQRTLANFLVPSSEQSGNETSGPAPNRVVATCLETPACGTVETSYETDTSSDIASSNPLGLKIESVFTLNKNRRAKDGEEMDVIEIKPDDDEDMIVLDYSDSASLPTGMSVSQSPQPVLVHKEEASPLGCESAARLVVKKQDVEPQSQNIPITMTYGFPKFPVVVGTSPRSLLRPNYLNSNQLNTSPSSSTDTAMSNDNPEQELVIFRKQTARKSTTKPARKKPLRTKPKRKPFQEVSLKLPGYDIVVPIRSHRTLQKYFPSIRKCKVRVRKLSKTGIRKLQREEKIKAVAAENSDYIMHRSITEENRHLGQNSVLESAVGANVTASPEGQQHTSLAQHPASSGEMFLNSKGPDMQSPSKPPRHAIPSFTKGTERFIMVQTKAGFFRVPVNNSSAKTASLETNTAKLHTSAAVTPQSTSHLGSLQTNTAKFHTSTTVTTQSTSQLGWRSLLSGKTGVTVSSTIGPPAISRNQEIKSPTLALAPTSGQDSNTPAAKSSMGIDSNQETTEFRTGVQKASPAAAGDKLSKKNDESTGAVTTSNSNETVVVIVDNTESDASNSSTADTATVSELDAMLMNYLTEHEVTEVSDDDQDDCQESPVPESLNKPSLPSAAQYSISDHDYYQKVPNTASATQIDEQTHKSVCGKLPDVGSTEHNFSLVQNQKTSEKPCNLGSGNLTFDRVKNQKSNFINQSDFDAAARKVGRAEKQKSSSVKQSDCGSSANNVGRAEKRISTCGKQRDCGSASNNVGRAEKRKSTSEKQPDFGSTAFNVKRVEKQESTSNKQCDTESCKYQFTLVGNDSKELLLDVEVPTPPVPVKKIKTEAEEFAVAKKAAKTVLKETAADRIRRLKAQLQRQQEEAERAKLVIESSRTRIETMDME